MDLGVVRVRVGWAFGVVWATVGCAGPTVGGDPTDDGLPTSDAPDSDTRPTADTDAVGADTDSDASDTDPTPDTDPPPRDPPASWDAGLVDVSSAAFAAAGVTAFLGDPARMAGPQAARAMFADVDGDGRVDVMVDQSLYGADTQTRALRMFRYDVPSGALVRDATLELPFAAARNQGFLGGLDLDGDGRDELLQESGDLVWWPDGSGGFEPGLILTHVERLQRAAFPSLSVVDVDGDGWLDLMFGSDSCDWSYRVLQRTGVRTYDVRDDLVYALEPMRLTRVGSARLGDGRPALLAVGTACALSAPAPGGFLVRSAASAADGAPRWEDQDLTPSNTMWKLDPQFAGLPFTTVMPMGGLNTDLDGDLRPDVALSLGYQTLAVLQGLGGGGYRDASSLPFLTTSGVLEVPWGLVAPDLDRDGTPELIFGTGDDVTSFYGFHGIGFPPRVYWGRGDLTFEDVTAPIGVTASGSWHGMMLDDLDGDADPDVAVGGWGNPPVVLRNDVELGGQTIALRLHGTTSNPLGFGAQVELEADGLPPRAQVVGGEANPDSLPRDIVFFGLGANTVAHVVRVRWPSGVVQEVRDLAAGQTWDLTEPPSVVLSEVDRHLPADGASTVRVDIWPRDARGDVVAATSVTLSLGGTGPTVAQAPTAQPDGSWQAVLMAPAAPGSTRVEVSVDGVPYQVAPRIWWD